MLDWAYTALLDDLHHEGLLESTLVLATGKFGRTPRLNNRGGQILGASDRHGEEPRDRPVSPTEIAATVYHSLGINSGTELPGADGRPMRLVNARPILELF
jgi:hypothetical protein